MTGQDRKRPRDLEQVKGKINMTGKLYDLMSWGHFKIGFDQERGINKIISDILPSVGNAHLTENQFKCFLFSKPQRKFSFMLHLTSNDLS